jgi:hypothetical protein
MKDCQKVYIRGIKNRGADVIKLLEDLGGINSYHCSGNYDTLYYYIGPDGNINCEDIGGNGTYIFLKEFYTEISLERKKWKPEYKDCYYHINVIGDVIRSIWANSQMDKLCLEFGNCFKTKEEAEVAKYKIKEMLKK